MRSLEAIEHDDICATAKEVVRRCKSLRGILASLKRAGLEGRLIGEKGSVRVKVYEEVYGSNRYVTTLPVVSISETAAVMAKERRLLKEWNRMREKK